MSNKAIFDTLRSLAYTGISGTYAALGDPMTIRGRIVCVTNLTNAHMILSTDNSVSAGQMIVPAGAAKLYDITANMNPNLQDDYVVGIDVQFYVKEVSAPNTGSVYIEIVG